MSTWDAFAAFAMRATETSRVALAIVGFFEATVLVAAGAAETAITVYEVWKHASVCILCFRRFVGIRAEAFLVVTSSQWNREG